MFMITKVFKYDFEFVLLLWTHSWIEYEYEFDWLCFGPNLWD